MKFGISDNAHETILNKTLKYGRIAGVSLLGIVFVVGFVMWNYIAFEAVNHLGEVHFKIAQPVPLLTAASVVATAIVLTAYLASTGDQSKNVARSVALTAFIGWIAVMLLLSLLDKGLTSGVVAFKEGAKVVESASEATAAVEAWRINIPPDLLEIAKFIYGIIAVLPFTIGLLLWVVHSSEQPNKYGSLSHGAMTVGLFVLKLALAVAMFSFEAYFGLKAGYSPLMAIPAALLNAIVFTVALNEIKAAASDKVAASLWCGIALFYAALMFSVAYEVGLQFGGEAAFPEAPKPIWLRQFAQTGFLASIGLSAIVLTLTIISHWRASRPKTDGHNLAWQAGKIMSKPANMLNDAKRGWNEERSASKRIVMAKSMLTPELSDAQVQLITKDVKAPDNLDAGPGKE